MNKSGAKYVMRVQGKNNQIVMCLCDIKSCRMFRTHKSFPQLNPTLVSIFEF